MENPYLIAGLGNPGREYERTRHNAGFLAVERLARRRKAVWKEEKKFWARLARAEWDGCRLLFCQPQTYMNSSGRAVAAVVSYFRIELTRVLVLVDDADLPLGQVRLRPDGSSGGHHGLESVEASLGSRDYARLRIGIGRERETGREIRDYVLSSFAADEAAWLEAVLDRVVDQAECWLRDGTGTAMNRFNGVVKNPLAKER